MPLKVAFLLYLACLLYAALMYFLGPIVPIATIALGFGLLVIPYLALEWIFTPGLALLMGFQARWWSVPAVLVFGAPLVVLCTIVTPVVSAGREALSVPVPWLAVYAKSKASIVPVIQQRLLWWSILFVASLLCGWLIRRFGQRKSAA